MVGGGGKAFKVCCWLVSFTESVCWLLNLATIRFVAEIHHPLTTYDSFLKRPLGSAQLATSRNPPGSAQLATSRNPPGSAQLATSRNPPGSAQLATSKSDGCRASHFATRPKLNFGTRT